MFTYALTMTTGTRLTTATMNFILEVFRVWDCLKVSRLMDFEWKLLLRKSLSCSLWLYIFASTSPYQILPVRKRRMRDAESAEYSDQSHMESSYT